MTPEQKKKLESIIFSNERMVKNMLENHICVGLTCSSCPFYNEFETSGVCSLNDYYPNEGTSLIHLTELIKNTFRDTHPEYFI